MDDAGSLCMVDRATAISRGSVAYPLAGMSSVGPGGNGNVSNVALGVYRGSLPLPCQVQSQSNQIS